MTNLRMVYPEVNFIPSGGISVETAAEFRRCGTCAVSRARNFFAEKRLCSMAYAGLLSSLGIILKLWLKLRQQHIHYPDIRNNLF
jgi:hypothetical protein